jgi:hypothetical protein
VARLGTGRSRSRSRKPAYRPPRRRASCGIAGARRTTRCSSLLRRRPWLRRCRPPLRCPARRHQERPPFGGSSKNHLAPGRDCNPGDPRPRRSNRPQDTVLPPPRTRPDRWHRRSRRRRRCSRSRPPDCNPDCNCRCWAAPPWRKYLLRCRAGTCRQRFHNPAASRRAQSLCRRPSDQLAPRCSSRTRRPSQHQSQRCGCSAWRVAEHLTCPLEAPKFGGGAWGAVGHTVPPPDRRRGRVMALRTGHGNGAGSPRVEVLPVDELPELPGCALFEEMAARHLFRQPA